VFHNKSPTCATVLSPEPSVMSLEASDHFRDRSSVSLGRRRSATILSITTGSVIFGGSPWAARHSLARRRPASLRSICLLFISYLLSWSTTHPRRTRKLSRLVALLRPNCVHRIPVTGYRLVSPVLMKYALTRYFAKRSWSWLQPDCVVSAVLPVSESRSAIASGKDIDRMDHLKNLPPAMLEQIAGILLVVG
jgi:hypothetical protein